MQWADFLANEAATNSLSPEQTAAFVERLKPKNSGKSEAKLASELNIGAAAFKSGWLRCMTSSPRIILN